MDESMTRLFFAVLFSINVFLPTVVAADTSTKPGQLQMVEDLQSLVSQMAEQHQPMVIEMAGEYCTYCHLLEEEILQPLLLSGEYESKALIRKLDIDDPSLIVDFDGSEISQQAFSRRYKVFLTPTVLFLGPDGSEVAPRMTGIPMIEFYGHYLAQSIEQARSNLAKKVTAATN